MADPVTTLTIDFDSLDRDLRHPTIFIFDIDNEDAPLLWEEKIPSQPQWIRMKDFHYQYTSDKHALVRFTCYPRRGGFHCYEHIVTLGKDDRSVVYDEYDLKFDMSLELISPVTYDPFYDLARKINGLGNFLSWHRDNPKVKKIMPLEPQRPSIPPAYNVFDHLDLD